MSQKPTLYLLFGYPGAGKTTTAEALAKLTGAVHLSSDKERLVLFPEPTFSQNEHDILYAYLDKQTEELLRAGRDVIYDANLNRLQHRQEKYLICKLVDAEPRLLWVKTKRELAKERAMHESRRQLWPKHETPAQLFDRVADVIEEPTSEEHYTALDGTKITSSYIQQQLGL